MKTIKFRVWDEDSETMLYSDEEMVDYWWEITPFRVGYVSGTTGGNTFEPPEPIVTYINGEKIMQFIGFKDKNDEEIYEGDIIKCVTGMGVIIWDEDCCAFKVDWFMTELDINKSWIPFMGFKSREIIGNIYENPELLQTAKKSEH